MMPSLWIAKTGLDAQQTRMAVVSNNIANVNTTGYKRSRAAFEDLLYLNVNQPGGQTSQQSQSPSGLMLGMGVRVAGTEKLFTQGELIQTSNQFNLAIQGRGFFQITLPDGSLGYSRDGSFQLNSDGKLVTADGYALQPEITIPAAAQSVTIGRDGTVSVQQSGQAAPTQVGSVQTADFINPGGLQPRGENLYVETAASGSPQTGSPGVSGLGTLAQGFLEGSNVNVAEELVSMIETQRAYEMSSKAIAATDSMLQFMNNH